jgi:hypothetical protein
MTDKRIKESGRKVTLVKPPKKQTAQNIRNVQKTELSFTKDEQKPVKGRWISFPVFGETKLT